MQAGSPPREVPEYGDYVTALRSEHPELAEELAGFTGLGAVLDWMKRRQLCQAAIDLVGQDEFEYDFLIQLEPQGRWLALGVT